MLLGHFTESTDKKINMDFDGPVLKAVVEFIYMEYASLFHKPCFRDVVPTIAAVINAANFLALPELGDLAENFATDSIQKDHSLACSFMAACEPYGDVTIKMEELAMTAIRFDPQILLDKNSLQLLNSTQLQKILEDEELDINEITRFMTIQLWGTSMPDGEGIEEDLGCEYVSLNDVGLIGQRQKEAIELIKKLIHLERIDPATLTSTVAPSKLVSDELMCEAYKILALSAQKKFGDIWVDNRMKTVWNDTPGSTLFCSRFQETKQEFLRCNRLMMSGTYKWKILIEEQPSLIKLGIAHTSGRFDDIKPKYCAWGSDGKMYWSDDSRNNESNFRSFEAGTQLTFILDCHDNRLTVKDESSYSNASIRYICNFWEIRDGGFVPFAILGRGSKVRFVGYGDGN